MAAPASELGWVVHFAPVVRFTPLSPTMKNISRFHWYAECIEFDNNLPYILHTEYDV